MSHNLKKAKREMEKAIFISADCWLEVFDFLAPSQLGLEIALISRRFDCFVDEHFKTRKWTLENKITIGREIRENGTKQLKIGTYGKALPIPQNPLPNKVIGFGWISIYYFDHNVLIFLRHFDRFFSTCTTLVMICTKNVRISEFVVRNIWPMLKDTIRLISLTTVTFRQMRQLVPSLLNDCPSLHNLIFEDDICPEFPPDDSANASDGQAVAKWLFSSHPDNLPKVLRCHNNSAVDQWLATVEQIKTAFSNASAPLNFFIFVHFLPSSPFDSFLPFELTNHLTGEHLKLLDDENSFLLIRSPIVYDKEKWNKAMYELLTDGENQIEICIEDDDGVDEGLLNAAASARPSGDQKQQNKQK